MCTLMAILSANYEPSALRHVIPTALVVPSQPRSPPYWPRDIQSQRQFLRPKPILLEPFATLPVSATATDPSNIFGNGKHDNFKLNLQNLSSRKGSRK